MIYSRVLIIYGLSDCLGVPVHYFIFRSLSILSSLSMRLARTGVYMRIKVIGRVDGGGRAVSIEYGVDL